MMSKDIKHSGIYQKLVHSKDDILGQVAYCLYKGQKRDYIVSKQAELGADNVTDDVIREFIKIQTDDQLELYRVQAEKISRNFIDASYLDQVNEIEKNINQEYGEKYNELAKTIQPRSFWYGVVQSITASFIFILLGWLILKYNGVWDILLKKLTG